MHIIWEFFKNWLTFSIEFFGLILFINTIGNKCSLAKGAKAIAERKDADHLGLWIMTLALLVTAYHVFL